MLRRRFMMQKSGSGYVYKCKFELQYGGKIDRYLIDKPYINSTPTAVYGIGFSISAGILSVNNPQQMWPTIEYVNLIDYDTSIDNLEIKVTKPNSSVETYNIPLVREYGAPGGGSITNKAISGTFALIDFDSTKSIGFIQYDGSRSSSFPLHTTTFTSAGLGQTTHTTALNLYENGLAQGTYTIELTYTSSADLSTNKLYIYNLGGANSYYENKSTYYDLCVSFAKKQWLQTDGVFVDNMYKQDGTI